MVWPRVRAGLICILHLWRAFKLVRLESLYQAQNCSSRGPHCSSANHDRQRVLDAAVRRSAVSRCCLEDLSSHFRHEADCFHRHFPVMKDFKQLWQGLGVSSTYLKVESHSRNASLDIPLEEQRLQHTIRHLRRWLFLSGVLLSVCLLALATNIVLQHKSLVVQKSPIPKCEQAVL